MRSNLMVWTTAAWAAAWIVAGYRPAQAVGVGRGGWVEDSTGGGGFRGVRERRFPDHPTFRRLQWSPGGELRVMLATRDELVFDRVDEATVEAWVREPAKERFYRGLILDGSGMRDRAPGGDCLEGGRPCRR